jgi:hypothetical protein
VVMTVNILIRLIMLLCRSGPVAIPRQLSPYESDGYSWSQATKDAISEWYQLDENSLVELLVLNVDAVKQAIAEGPSSEKYLSLLNCIQQLEGSKLSVTSDVFVNRSVEECAAREALSSELGVQRSLWVPNEAALQDESQQSNFLKWLAATYPAQQRRPYGGASGNTWQNNTKEAVTAGLASMLQVRDGWERSGCGVGMPGAALTEMLFHSQLAQTYCEKFVGRHALIQSCVGVFFCYKFYIFFLGKSNFTL